ncbi:hypothetical protein FJ951_14365 [Mesorhizobium sp. B2-2-3]|uniref:hypothetical protein n=1 Tax=Mesorhizobium sp. B2-2-3 TaxID=2589963 RepID=UPI00112AFAA2|nr:hypothetical protein [Mesorhizobium sp. B2-2-3]TPM46201.1 hypothetical protein FJ951_14365 [Mesorhizobium sp. B2-2-3]
MITTLAKIAFTRTASALVVAASLFSAGTASAHQRWVDISNVGSSEIVGVYISNIDKQNWGRNLLGSYSIDVGYEMTVDPRRPEGYCRFDVLMEFADGSQTIAWDQNLCELTDVVVSESGYYTI